VNKIILKPGREKSLLRRHPWVFSGAIARVEGSPKAGDTVRIVAQDGRFLALRCLQPGVADFGARMGLARGHAHRGRLLPERVAAAMRMREALIDTEAGGAVRLIHGESDGLPGLIADRYGDVVVMQISSAGCHRWRDAIMAALDELTVARALYERSDADVLEVEDWSAASGSCAARWSRRRWKSGRTARGSRSMSRAGIKPASISTSATTGSLSASLRSAGMC